SPLLPLTHDQAKALRSALSEDWECEVFISMRYWNPRSDVTIKAIKQFAPDHIIALPLYPQFSTTTTGSSFTDWKRACQAAGLDIPTHYLCCYPTQEDFVAAYAALILPHYEKAKAYGSPRILFSAHGLPEKIVKKGDPYQWQVEQTAKAVVQTLGLTGLDWQVCYQSRVGPLTWIGPATDAEIIRAGEEGVPVVVAPISFVSEHSETLVELDIEYGKLAREHNVPHYERAPAVGDNPQFISGLAKLCHQAYGNANGAIEPDGSKRLCPQTFGQCLCRNLL
ncbi:MAG: ferrochelatase, partial [Rickettsiales bacterium]